MKILIFIIITLFFTACGSSSSSSSTNLTEINDTFTITDKYSYTIDGDTNQFENYKIRSYGVEAFEYSSSTRMTEQAIQCTNGDESFIKYLGEIIKNQVEGILLPSNEYKLNLITTDIYGRYIGQIILNNNIELGLYLVEQGYLVPNIIDDNEYKVFLKNALNFAKINKKGLWEYYSEQMSCLELMYSYE